MSILFLGFLFHFLLICCVILCFNFYTLVVFPSRDIHFSIIIQLMELNSTNSWGNLIKFSLYDSFYFDQLLMKMILIMLMMMMMMTTTTTTMIMMMMMIIIIIIIIILNNLWMRLSILWRIMEIEDGVKNMAKTCLPLSIHRC